MKNKKGRNQVALIILDGWGHRVDTKDNAIANAQTPFFDSLIKKYPHSLLKASGLAVGLPEGQMGNSEVGHTTIGAGSPLDTDLVRIDKAIKNKSFGKNKEILTLFKHVKKHDSTLHVYGMLSDGGVHSHERHLIAFLKEAKAQKISKVALHIFTDGRDTPPQSAASYLKNLENVLTKLGKGFFIASLSGRYYAMDRDNNWDRLAKTEEVIFECKGNVCSVKPSEFMEEHYKQGKIDELLEPTVCLNFDKHGCSLEKNDGAFFFNFRADRARMLTQKLLLKKKKQNIHLLTLTEYSDKYDTPVAFPTIKIEKTLASEISKAKLKQSHIAETEKFPHATYFLNGGKEKPHAKESHIMLPSRKDVKTHDEAPEMKAKEIADKAIEEIEKGVDFIFINFANPDMVGHTANVPAIITAIETVDKELKRVVEKLAEKDGVAFITADHGNAELNVDPETGAKHTAHTINPVPAILTSNGYKLKNGTLADIAPTVLSLLKIKTPKTMSGKVIITPQKR